MKEQFEQSNRRVPFGKHDIKVTTYYLWRHKAGLRIEVKRLTWTQTVEIQLLAGDGDLILKTIYQRKSLSSPSQREIDKVVEELIQFAIKNGLMKY